MSKRLKDSFQPGDAVEITFDGERWLRARIVAHEPPGVWVQSWDGRYWFVTNTRRIRHPELPHDA